MTANGGLVNAARQGRPKCETSAVLNTTPERREPTIALWRQVAIWPVAGLVRLWLSTIRIEMDEPDKAIITARGEPTLYLLWHNRLFMTSEIFHRYRNGQPVYGLISASSDGAWLAAYFYAVGMRAVRGSSSRGGREAASGLVEVLRQGYDVGVTPDGPRGPVYVMKPGALIVARRAQKRVALVGMDFESAWRVSSWDGFHLPRPFSRVRLRFELVPGEQLEDRDGAAHRIGARLVELNPDRTPAPVRRRA